MDADDALAVTPHVFLDEPPVATSPRKTERQEQEELLLAAGWEPTHEPGHPDCCWHDPKLPRVLTHEKNPETGQVHVTAAGMPEPLSVAVARQMARDNAS